MDQDSFPTQIIFESQCPHFILALLTHSENLEIKKNCLHIFSNLMLADQAILTGFCTNTHFFKIIEIQLDINFPQNLISIYHMLANLISNSTTLCKEVLKFEFLNFFLSNITKFTQHPKIIINGLWFISNLLNQKFLCNLIELKKILNTIEFYLNTKTLSIYPTDISNKIISEGLWALSYWPENFDSKNKLTGLAYLHQKKIHEILYPIMALQLAPHLIPLLKILGLLSSGLQQTIEEFHPKKMHSFILYALEKENKQVMKRNFLLISNLVVNSKLFFNIFFNDDFIFELYERTAREKDNSVLYEIAIIIESFLIYLKEEDLVYFIEENYLFDFSYHIIQENSEKNFEICMEILKKVFLVINFESKK